MVCGTVFCMRKEKVRREELVYPAKLKPNDLVLTDDGREVPVVYVTTRQDGMVVVKLKDNTVLNVSLDEVFIRVIYFLK